MDLRLIVDTRNNWSSRVADHRIERPEGFDDLQYSQHADGTVETIRGLFSQFPLNQSGAIILMVVDVDECPMDSEVIDEKLAAERESVLGGDSRRSPSIVSVVDRA